MSRLGKYNKTCRLKHATDFDNKQQINLGSSYTLLKHSRYSIFF